MFLTCSYSEKLWNYGGHWPFSRQFLLKNKLMIQISFQKVSRYLHLNNTLISSQLSLIHIKYGKTEETKSEYFTKCFNCIKIIQLHAKMCNTLRNYLVLCIIPSLIVGGSNKWKWVEKVEVEKIYFQNRDKVGGIRCLKTFILVKYINQKQNFTSNAFQN